MQQQRFAAAAAARLCAAHAGTASHRTPPHRRAGPDLPLVPSPAAAPQLVPASAAFQAFYASKFGGSRRLHWQHNLATCLVKATFPSGRKELDVSLYQAMVLLLFNGADAVPFPAIREATGIEDAELRRTLQSLACAQHRVLRKDPKGRDVDDGDVFHFNPAFTAPLIRIRINQIQMKETKEEATATNESVLADRTHQIEAMIVRIMKARKALAHQALMSEVFAQLRFPAKVRGRPRAPARDGGPAAAPRAPGRGRRAWVAGRLGGAHRRVPPSPSIPTPSGPTARPRRLRTSRSASRHSSTATTWNATRRTLRSTDTWPEPARFCASGGADRVPLTCEQGAARLLFAVTATDPHM